MADNVLTLKVLSPLVLHRRRSSAQFAPTLDYVPGSTVRGAFADLYLQGDRSRAEEPLFRDLFLSGAVRFSDFLPSRGASGVLTRLLPATAVACKRFAEHSASSLADSLLRLELVNDLESDDTADALPLAQAVTDLHSWLTCPECELRPSSHQRDRCEPGYYASPETHEAIVVRRRMVASTAIRRTTQTVAHGLLFSHEVVEESGLLSDDVLFRGVVDAPTELLESLQELAPRGQELALGHGRSRGFGYTEVQSWSTARVERSTLRERWDALNENARELWSRHKRSPAGSYFSLTLSSHLALRDATCQPVLGDVTAADLGLPSAAERRRCVLTSLPVPGWNAALGMPKADIWALGRGSVLLFRLPPHLDPGPTLERLQEIETVGVGERRAEGFGRVAVCDPFHYTFVQREAPETSS